VDKVGPVAEQALQHGRVAVNDGFHGGFELLYSRALLCDGLDPLGESGPIAKVVPAGYG
jgi:hypothetical protein